VTSSRGCYRWLLELHSYAMTGSAGTTALRVLCIDVWGPKLKPQLLDGIDYPFLSMVDVATSFTLRSVLPPAMVKMAAAWTIEPMSRTYDHSRFAMS
jgi:hypothetical protein